MSILEMLLKPKIAYAHCDIPCGIYDPHQAQVAAHTVLRMVLLANQLDKNAADYHHKLARYTTTKEQHCEIIKHEVRIIWGDFYKPEHLASNKDLHEMVWKVLKKASAARQTMSEQEAKDLVGLANQFAEMFWKTKGVKTLKMKAPYPTEAEIVLPTA